MRRFARSLGSCLILFLALTLVVPAVAQETESPDAKKEAKAKAREERVQEYLRKKEERRLRREAEAKLKQEEDEARRTAEAIAASTQQIAVAEPDDDAAAESSRKIKKEERKTDKTTQQRSSQLPRQLAKVHATLRESEFGQDPMVATYLDLIGAGEASAQQIAAFGSFVGQSGRVQTALAYYDHALDLDGEDTTIWLNAGTLQRQIGNYRAAAGAYSEVLSRDPNHAYAHYNLGAVLDHMGEYDSAIEAYKTALTLDPTLGDPSINPQAANNEKLTAVRLMLYKEQTGTLGLPLVTVPDGELDGGK